MIWVSLDFIKLVYELEKNHVFSGLLNTCTRYHQEQQKHKVWKRKWRVRTCYPSGMAREEKPRKHSCCPGEEVI